jgi:methylmalonyl-CoA mutase
MHDLNQKFSIAGDFPPVTRENWLDKIHDDLKGKDHVKTTSWKIEEGIELLPFYLFRDMDQIEYLSNFHNILLDPNPGTDHPRNWIYREKIEVDHLDSSNQQAQSALYSGAGGIDFIFNNNPLYDIKELMKGLSSSGRFFNFTFNHNPVKFLNLILDYFHSGDLEHISFSGGINFDPVNKLSRTGKIDYSDFDQLAEMIRLTSDLKNFQTLTINSSFFHNSYASAVQEIAFTLNILVDYFDQLTERGITPSEIINKLEISVSVGTDFLTEIAKLRALRILVYFIASEYKVTHTCFSAIRLHAETAQRSLTLFDPHVNIIRNTTESMSAILGGCNSLSIIPFNHVYSRSDGFSTRISRNISNILKEESYFGKVADPVAGSWLIESLTHQLIMKSYELFRSVESQGGYIESFRKGIIQEKLVSAKKISMEKISTRKESIIGINHYPNITAIPGTEEFNIFPLENWGEKTRIFETRGAAEFEKIRLKTLAFTKKSGKNNIPVIYIAALGNNKTMIKERASFAGSFFGCAGFGTVEIDPGSSMQELVENTMKSGARIIVICGADDDYLNLGIEYGNLLKSKYKCVLVMAGNPGTNKDYFIQAGIDEFIHLKSNAVDMLKYFQDQLNIS